MKNSIFILGSFLISFFNFLNAQQTLDTLNGNSISAIINDRGRLFNNPQLGRAGYEFPAGSGNHLIFSGGFWFGGTNQNGDLKLAAFGYSGYDFYSGPYSSTNSYSDLDYSNDYLSSIWSVKKSDILHHISNYNQQGYVAPDGILNWPGNGDPSIGVAEQLAPYIDENNNGIYEPHLGEYPCIKGDEASYQIMHEDLANGQSGGQEIGAEIHIMVYQYQSLNFIDSTTFMEVKVFNRGQNSYNDFKASIYMDPDIGFSEDEYIGSTPTKNLVYAYNADNFDEGGNGAPGYGANPPAIGIVSLNKDFEYFWYLQRSTISLLSDYWNSMNGRNPDGSFWSHGITGATTQFLFDGVPGLGTGWTEMNIDGNGTANPMGDRRFIATSIEETFNPGDTLIYNYAIIVNRQGDHLENVQGLINYADSVQNYFNANNSDCSSNISLGLTEEFQFGKLEIYPNPATNQMNVVWNNVSANEIKIFSFQGLLINTIPISANENEKLIDISGLSPGIYFVIIGSGVKKVVVN